MSEQTLPHSKADPAPPETVAILTPAHSSLHSRVGRAISRMSAMQMLLVVMLVIFLWQWLDTHLQIGSTQQELARRLTEMDGNNKANKVLMMQVQELTRELSVKVGVLEARSVEVQNQRAALESMYHDLASSRDEMVLAEVEQMLLIAGQQLKLSANVRAALIAMQQADDRLKHMNRAALDGLRKAINRDIDRLRTLPDVNIPNISSRLDDLVAAVDMLPLLQDVTQASQEVGVTPPANPPENGALRKLVREIWGDMKQLVRIENTQKGELPLLLPEQAFFLRENLKLRLLSARLALLSHDESGFRRDLQSVQKWMTRYFDVGSARGFQAVKILQKLRESSISIELPDVSESLEAARNYRLALGTRSR